MYFELILLGNFLLGFFIYSWICWKKRHKKTYVGYLEPDLATETSYKEGTFEEPGFFHIQDGMINLKEHPELAKFHVKNGKDVLVEVWRRNESMYLEEGMKIAIFEFLETPEKTLAIPCIRVFKSLREEDTDDVLIDYRNRYILTSFVGEDHKIRLYPERNFIGIVRYESI